MNSSSNPTLTDNLFSSMGMNTNMNMNTMVFGFSWDELISTASPFLLALVALWLFNEQISYMKKKSILPGPTFVIPFLGTAIPLVRDPTTYWNLQNTYATQTPMGVSANYFLGMFIVFIRDSHLSLKVLTNVRPGAFSFVGHLFGKKLFGEHNMIYLTGQEHKDIRRRMAPNFTLRALSTYAQIQQTLILNHLKLWEKVASNKNNHPIPLRFLARDLNLETSQTVFVGPYLDHEARQQFNADYHIFNVGLLTLPIDFPGFAFRSARLAVNRLAKILSSCAVKSKARLSAGGDPACLIDFWMQDCLREEQEALLSGVPPSPPIPTTTEIGHYMFDFLFAAQDASTSSLLWAITYLDANPDVLAKVRDEVTRIWSPDQDMGHEYHFVSADQLSSMTYTHAVAREVLRIRPPATLVPHSATADFHLTDGYTIPKGTLVFPSVYESSFQGFPDPERFDPDRFLQGRDEDKLYKTNYLVFGAGAHQCVGQRYATNYLVLFIAMFSTLMDFKRHWTQGCDDIVYNPTICPKDDCTVYLTRRVPEYPNLDHQIIL